MYIKKLNFKNYRNLNEGCCEFSQETNIIYGQNGQGKTNLLEALWLFCGGKSFRGSKDKELIKFGEQGLNIETEFFAADRVQTAKISASPNRKAALNGINLSSPLKLTGNISCVIFYPEHLLLIKGPAAQRRKFVDSAICQVYPKYASMLKRYKNIINQRNALLKDIRRGKEPVDSLEEWDKCLCDCGAQLFKARSRYIDLVKKFAPAVYEDISKGREKLSIFYNSDIENTDAAGYSENFNNCLKQNQRRDIITGCTNNGPHRDDLIFLLDENDSRAFASQGQQRSIVLSLKLSEAQILKHVLGEAPYILLDDVMSELDMSRQEFIAEKILGNQVFITCCDTAHIPLAKKARLFYVENGSVNQV